MQGDEVSRDLIDFCLFSFDSANPRVVYHAAVLLFNHVLCWKRDMSLLKVPLERAIDKICTYIGEPENKDLEALLSLVICECRIVYNNKDIYEYITQKYESAFKKAH